ncbi:MAG: hypothetical protein WA395_14765 [Nitrososphaeraceae archaeon]
MSKLAIALAFGVAASLLITWRILNCRRHRRSKNIDNALADTDVDMAVAG